MENYTSICRYLLHVHARFGAPPTSDPRHVLRFDTRAMHAALNAQRQIPGAELQRSRGDDGQHGRVKPGNSAAAVDRNPRLSGPSFRPRSESASATLRLKSHQRMRERAACGPSASIGPPSQGAAINRKLRKSCSQTISPTFAPRLRPIVLRAVSAVTFACVIWPQCSLVDLVDGTTMTATGHCEAGF
jgi:hypothetical protein